MYMDCENNIDYKKDFVFMTDKQGNLTGGGFNIQSELLKHTLGTNNNGNEDDNIQSGGNHITPSSSIINTMKNMVIPAGIYCSQDQCNHDHTIKYQNNSEPIEDTVYDKLLDMMAPGYQMVHTIKTRKKRDKPKKTTRKR